MTVALAPSNKQRRAAKKAIGTKPVTPAAPRRQAPAAKKYEHDTGLAWLLHKKQINSVQSATGERYGRWYRAAIIGGGEPIKGMSLTERVDGGGAAGLGVDYADTVAWLNESREKLNAARSKVSNHTGLILALDLICGRQLRPTEIMPDNQRGREEIVTSLRIALDMLERVR